VICKFPPPVIAPTFNVAAAEFEIETFPEELVILPIVVAPVPVFDNETPAALEMPLVDNVPAPALVSVRRPAEFVKVPVNDVLPDPPTDTVEPETVALPIVTLPVLEFVMAKPPLLVNEPLNVIAPVPVLLIVKKLELLATLPPNNNAPLPEFVIVLVPVPAKEVPVLTV
jgi:hypothetical protein